MANDIKGDSFNHDTMDSRRISSIHQHSEDKNRYTVCNIVEVLWKIYYLLRLSKIIFQ